MSHAKALAQMAKRLQPLNAHADEPIVPILTILDWIRNQFLELASAMEFRAQVVDHSCTDVSDEHDE